MNNKQYSRSQDQDAEKLKEGLAKIAPVQVIEPNGKKEE